MHLRNFEGAVRTADLDRSAAARTAAKPATTTPQTVTAAPSRGAFFEMMRSAAEPAAPDAPGVRAGGTVGTSSVDQNLSGVRGGSSGSPAGQTAVRNAVTSDTTPTPAPVPETPVDIINRLLTKLGYDASSFQARVTSAHINYPGMSYDYPLLEVTVNGERVGFHLSSAMHDPRMTAANISSMMGRPVMNLSVFS
jgi:hypothetical protein